MKQIVPNYSFNTTARTVTLSDFTATYPVLLRNLMLITDVTTNQILYNFADASVATATVSSNNVVTLSALPSGPANTDTLQIIYDYQVLGQNAVGWISGTASATGTADTSVIAAQGGNLKVYVTGISVANTGTANTLITLKNGSAGSTLWQTIAPSAGGSNINFPTPISTSANIGLFFASGTASTTVYVSATGYVAP